ncbi:MAG: hypothetical protein KA538_01335 [Azonexus sp.]|nr:hypothetical protein [Azonexus sp.]
MLQTLQRIFVAALLLVALPAVAQDDPPARVGRLAVFENEVFFRADRSIQAEPATLNWPISSGAILETGRRGRAEVWVGSTAYRLGDDSQVEFAVVDDARVDVRVNDGSLAVSILDRDQVDDVVVTTPEGLVRFLTPGRYRIDVRGDHSELTVQAGRATFDDRQREMPLAAGQKLSRWSDGRERLDGDGNQDAFDRWVAARENATLATTARRHVSPHMTGYQDLDAYGDWQSAPDYGTVWYPRGVADDWAPYRDGRWAWVAPWGWTWIDQAPWGFAPFHYGRWAIIHGRWAWVPGRLAPRPVYAPALVSWVGNPGWSVSFSFGAAPAVGWFPLAPREVYVPGHRHSHRYVERVNVTHVHNVTVIQRAVRDHERGEHRERYAYRDSPRALTVVPANLLREGRHISRDQIHRTDRRELERAPTASQTPGANWIAPPTAASRPRDGERNGFVGRDGRRDEQRQEGAGPRTRDTGRDNARREPPPAAPLQETAPRHSTGGREIPERRRSEEPRPPTTDETPSSRRILPPPQSERPAPAESRRDAFGRTLEAQPEAAPLRQPTPPVQRPEVVRPESRDAERDARLRGQPEERMQRREAPPSGTREIQPGAPREFRRENPGDMQRDTPRDMPRPERNSQREAPGVMPTEPQRRAEPPREVQPMPQPQRELPVQRMEPPRQPAPEVRAPIPQPQREMPVQRMEPPRQPAPEVRAPMPQPQREMPAQRMEPPRQPTPEFRAPPSQPQREMHQQRAEPPRQPAAPGGGQGDSRRRHDDERGPR